MLQYKDEKFKKTAHFNQQPQILQEVHDNSAALNVAYTKYFKYLDPL